MNQDGHDRALRYLNIYRVVQLYGGPEEGGWHDDVEEPIESRLYLSQAELDENLPELRAKVDELNKNSVSVSVTYSLRHQGHFAEASPKQRPTYE